MYANNIDIAKKKLTEQLHEQSNVVVELRLPSRDMKKIQHIFIQIVDDSIQMNQLILCKLTITGCRPMSILNLSIDNRL